MTRTADAYARISPYLTRMRGATRATRLHAWVYKRTRGRIGGKMLGAPVLTLRTTGRQSGRIREAPMFYIEHERGYAVVASNAGSPRPPAWWLNLQADPNAQAHVRGTTAGVHAREASDSETAALWPRFVEIYSGYDHYRSVTTRSLPVVILEPR